MKRPAAFLLLILLAPFPARGEQSSGRVRIGGVVKLAYTHRDRDSSGGVSAIDEAALRWVGLEIGGGAGRAGWLIELGSTLYQDPITGGGTPARSGPNEMGRMGVRQAFIDFSEAVPGTSIRVGTFIPAWGFYRERSPGRWDFADLPLVYYHPCFHELGWQNTGAALTVDLLAAAPDLPAAAPDLVSFSLFAVNGYFPSGLADAEAPFSDDSPMNELGLGSRVLIGAGPVRVYGGYYFEYFGRDLKGSSALESYQAAAWNAGIEARGPAGFFMAEWQSLLIADYQLMTDGSWEDLESMGGQVSGGIRFLERFTALGRLDWIEPNARDSARTVLDSRHDEVAAWTFGLNLELTEAVTIKLNYVLPREQGKRIDLDKGLVGGPYTARDDNYLRLQLEMVF